METIVFVCFLCDNNFTDKNILLDHLRDYEKLFPCNKCGKFLVSWNDLEIHLKNHSDEKPFLCNVCEKYFSKLRDLKRHKVIHNPFRAKNVGKV